MFGYAIVVAHEKILDIELHRYGMVNKGMRWSRVDGLAFRLMAKENCHLWGGTFSDPQDKLISKIESRK